MVTRGSSAGTPGYNLTGWVGKVPHAGSTRPTLRGVVAKGGRQLRSPASRQRWQGILARASSRLGVRGSPWLRSSNAGPAVLRRVSDDRFLSARLHVTTTEKCPSHSHTHPWAHRGHASNRGCVRPPARRNSAGRNQGLGTPACSTERGGGPPEGRNRAQGSLACSRASHPPLPALRGSGPRCQRACEAHRDASEVA